MIRASAVLGIAVIALGLVLTPGPNMIYLVSRSITQGRRAGLISLCGVAVGFIVYLIAANLGLTVVFTEVPQVYTAVKLSGAAYLAWLAWKALKPGGISVFTPENMPDDPPWRLFAMGLTTNLLNPKIAIMYVSLIPQFITIRAGHVLAQGLLLGCVQIVVSITVNLGIVLAAGAISVFLTRRPAWLRVQRYLMGTVLGALALFLVIGTIGGKGSPTA